jgi:outer membrane receptor protein involved in Fe transport
MDDRAVGFRRRDMIVRRVLLVSCFGILCPLHAANASPPQHVASKSNEDASHATRRVTIDLAHASLVTALSAIAREAGLHPAYNEDMLPRDVRVSLRVRDLPVMDAFERALAGTGLVATIRSGGTVMIVRDTRSTVAQSGVVVVTVLDAQHRRPLAGATVSLDDATSGVLTDANGVARFAGVSTGAHSITVRLIGRTKQSKRISVGDGQTFTLTVALDSRASALGEVVVTGTVIPTERKAIPNAMTVITAQQIRERGITRIDQLFRGDVPGLFAMNVGSSARLDEVTMFSRGPTALEDSVNNGGKRGSYRRTNPIKTYVDGVEMADSKYLSQIDPSSIERIEILTGPQASTIYGANALNGVMQIFTKRGATSRPQLNISASSGMTQNNFSSRVAPTHLADVSLSGVEGRLSYNTGGSWTYAGAWTPGKLTQRFSYNGGARITLSSKLNVDASGRQGYTRNKQNGALSQGLTNLSVTGASLAIAVLGEAPRVQTLTGRTFGVSVNYRPVSWWSHVANVGTDMSTGDGITLAPAFSGKHDSTLSVSSSTTARTSQSYNTTFQFPVSSIASVNLVLGGDHWRLTGSSWNATPPLSLTGTLAGAQVVRMHPSKNSGAYAQGQLGLGDRVFFTYGIRADWNPNYGEKADVRPGRYGLSYVADIGPISAKLRGSYGESIRPPIAGQSLGVQETKGYAEYFGSFYPILPSPGLGPESQRGGEGGIELYVGSRASLTITRFNQTVDNLIGLVGMLNDPPRISNALDSVRSLTPDLNGLLGNDISTCEDAGLAGGTGPYCYFYVQQYLNVGSIRNQGWELQGSVTLGPLTTRGTYSWTKSRVAGITEKYRALLLGTDFRVGQTFTYAPEHTWSFGMTYAHARTSISLFTNGVGQIYKSTNALALNISSPRLKQYAERASLLPINYRFLDGGYATSDLNASHQLSSRADVTVNVSNLTNYYQNDESPAFASPGRQTKVGVRFRW